MFEWRVHKMSFFRFRFSLNGEFIRCPLEKGRILVQSDDGDVTDDSDMTSDSDSDSGAGGDDEDDEVLSDLEENEMFSHTEFLDTINTGTYIIIYSHEGANETFYLCKVIETTKAATENILDDNEYCIPKNTPYCL